MNKLNPTCSNIEQVAQISHCYFPGKPLLTRIRTVECHQTIRIPCLHICEHICVWSRKAFAVCFLASFCDSARLNWALQFKSVDLCSLDCGNGSGADPWFGEIKGQGSTGCETASETERKNKEQNKGFVSRGTETGRDKDRKSVRLWVTI